ncbi:hypothetical protein [Pigmentiphaga sp. D-2]|uniref:hypothetical protein n=1 Tax=Pigmentiphaga sp. D-2 TaxID=1002116 RepID=UPI001050EBE9|nr:hypothetical protein [Pigmentiphaga sp. D-2]
MHQKFKAVLLAMMLATGGGQAAAQQEIYKPLESYESVQTPMGRLTVEEKGLAFDGKVIPQSLGEGDFPSLKKHYVRADKTQVLLAYSGGNACPATYEWLVIDAKRIVKSPRFGTCTDLVRVVRFSDDLIVEMLGPGVAMRYAFDGKQFSESMSDANGGRQAKDGVAITVYERPANASVGVAASDAGRSSGGQAGVSAEIKRGPWAKAESGNSYQMVQTPSALSSMNIRGPKGEERAVTFNQKNRISLDLHGPNEYGIGLQIITIRSLKDRDYLLVKVNLPNFPCGDFNYSVVVVGRGGELGVHNHQMWFCSKANRFFVERGKVRDVDETYLADKFVLGFENGGTRTGMFRVGRPKGAF